MSEVCTECGEGDEYGLCEIEGYRSLCLPCACVKMDQELDDQIKKELKVFFERTERKLTYDEFCFQCGIDIDIGKIQDLPELKLAYETEIAAIEEYNRSRQLELELDDSLPF